MDSGRDTRILELEGVEKAFVSRRGLLGRPSGQTLAVRSVDLSIRTGETFALVGESGSGKTTIARLIVGLETPSGGRIRLRGQELASAGGTSDVLRQHVQLVFQDPSGSLNPSKTIAQIVADPLLVASRRTSAAVRTARVDSLLEMVELPRAIKTRYPHHLSGGQKQRVGIARALACEPDLLVLDEPTSALDVSVQAKVITLLRRLQRELGLTYLVITHDLSLVRVWADRVGVMYLGDVVEQGLAEEVYTSPAHPYTRSLLASIPVVSDEERRSLPPATPLRGEIQGGGQTPSGCPFHPRCPVVMDDCDAVMPQRINLTDTHWVKCLRYDGRFEGLIVERGQLPGQNSPREEL